MHKFHNSGSFWFACTACQKDNELTAINLPSAEVVMCSHCHAPLGAWETLLAASGADSAELAAASTAPA